MSYYVVGDTMYADYSVLIEFLTAGTNTWLIDQNFFELNS